MKKSRNLLSLLILSGFFMLFSYLICLVISEFILYDSPFINQVDQFIPHLIGIKLVLLAVFSITRRPYFSYKRTLLGIVTGNIASVLWLTLYIGESITSYVPYGINAGLDTVFVLLITLLLNAYSSKKDRDEEIDEINDYMDMKKDFDALQKRIDEQKEELSFIEKTIEDKEDLLLKKNEEMAKWKDAPSYEASKTQSITVPLQIEISEEGTVRSLYLGKATEIEGEHTEDGDHSQTTQENHADVHIYSALNQVVTKLEQLSQTLLEQKKGLEEKEQQLKEETLALDHKQSAYDKQLYHVLFDAEDLEKNEVKLKDAHSEIIINKEDLAQIQMMIEETFPQ